MVFEENEVIDILNVLSVGIPLGLILISYMYIDIV